MIELVRTNDLVTLSLIETLLKEQGIVYHLFDQHMSVLEGSIGILPRRLMISEEREVEARRLLKDAGLASYLKTDEHDR